jgi:hypothetical protein
MLEQLGNTQTIMNDRFNLDNGADRSNHFDGNRLAESAYYSGDFNLMATIVNARDVLLQATTPRVATVTIAPNIEVDQSQVSGLGLIVNGTRLVFLEATTQVFQIAKTGTITPANTTLTALVRNLSSPATLTVVAGTLGVTPTLTDNQFTITPANMETDVVTLRVTVVENGVTYTDDVTIAKVREGSDSLNVILTNETVTLPADNLGNILNYSGAGGNIKVYQGTNDITSLCSYALAPSGNPSNLTYTLGATTGAYSVTSGYPASTDSTTLTFRITFGTTTIDKIFQVSKAKGGTNGLRGSQTFYVALTGTTATYSDTLATTTATANGGPILNDVVTQYNNSQGFAQTKFWNGSGWVIVNAVVDGNLLVSGTVGAAAFVANLLNADNVLTRNLTVRDNAGTVILSASQQLGGTYIADAAITNAKIGNIIKSNNFDGTIDGSDNITGNGTVGWAISKTGKIVIQNAVVRGAISADSGYFKGAVYGGAITSWAWPAAGTKGYYLGPEGLLLGNPNGGGNYFIYDQSSGNVTFKGSMDAASGTFSGSLTAAAVNAVNTINLAGQAVTIPASAFSATHVNLNFGTYDCLALSIASTGAPITIWFGGTFFAGASDASGGGGGIVVGQAKVRLVRNLSVTLATYDLGNGGSSLFSYQETPGAATHRYDIFFDNIDRQGASQSNTGYIEGLSLVALETKR